MNFPECGYLGYLIETTFQSYGLIFIIFFVIGMIIFRDGLSAIRLTIISLLFSLLISIFVISITYFSESIAINNSEYLIFNEKLTEIYDQKSKFTGDQINSLNSWAKCSISDGKISSHEYKTFILTFESFEKENEALGFTNKANETISKGNEKIETK